MKQSRLKSFGFAMRVIVGILRLPLSLALFWKYPHFAMLMDHMVTHLRVYSLFGKPYMAYVEVVFQSVSESRVLPFNFANPFEHWNPSTLQCTGFSGIRSKNLNCSWFDNYGENLIGLLSVALLALILVKTGRYLSTRPDLLPWQKQVLAVVERDYGFKFVISKIDANHLEIITMTFVAYCAADHTSKSVIGIIVSTVGLITLAVFTKMLTEESLRMYQAKPDSRPASAAGQPANNKLQLIVDTHSSRSARPPSVASLHPHTPAKQDQLIPDDLPVAEAAQFVFDRSTFPATAWSHYFLAARYVRALLLAVFATTVRSSVEQVVLSVLLESAYLAVLILFDFRGTRLERLFYTGVHSLMLLHLILRAVATSSGLSDRDVQLVVATMIVVVLVAYIFVHVLAALWLAGTLFGQTPSVHSAKAPQPHHVTKMQVLESEADLAAEQDALPLPQGRPFFEELPVAVPAHATHPVFPSYIDQDIPQEFSPDQQDIPEEKSQRAHVGQIEVAVRADRPTQPRSFGQTDQF